MNERVWPTQPEDWQPPSELLRSPPRPVALTVAGKAAAATAVLLLAGAFAGAVFLNVVAARDAARLEQLKRDGVSTSAEVVQVVRRRDKQPRRVVTYRYTVEGLSYQGRTTLRRRDRRPFTTGDQIAVRFLPANPRLSWMPGYEPKGVPLWLAPVAFLGLLVPAALIAAALRGQRSLLAEGRPAPARVTQCRAVRRQRPIRYRVHYEFRILSGAVRTGSYEAAKHPPAVGSVLTVLYHRERPGRNAPYPLPLARVAKF